MKKGVISVFIGAAFIFLSNSANAQKLASGYIDVSGSRVYVEGGGQGDLLIFVHAGFQDHRMWQKQVSSFIKTHRVLLVDLPGHGQTIDGATTPLSEEVIKTVMDSLGISKASFIGLSLGGSVITDFAISYPEKVEKLVLASSGLNGWDEGRQLHVATKTYMDQLDSSLAKKDTAMAAEVFAHYWFDGIDRDEKQPSDSNLRKQVLSTTYYTMKQHHVKNWPRFSSPTAIHKLAAIKVPVLILTGGLDMPEIKQMNTYLAQNISNAKQITIGDAGHLINIERPQRFNDEVRKFISTK